MGGLVGNTGNLLLDEGLYSGVSYQGGNIVRDIGDDIYSPLG